MSVKTALIALVFALPAHSAVIGVADTPTGSVLLHDEARMCVGDALYAEWVPVSGARIPAQAVKAPKAV